jgi:cell division protein FtsW (lipid II flippase)
MSYLVLAPAFLSGTPQRLLLIGVISAVAALVTAQLFSLVEQWYLRRIDRVLNRAVIRS